MQSFLTDFLAFFLMALLLEACSNSVNWGEMNYVETACADHTASDGICHPHDDHLYDISRSKGGGGKR